MATAKQLENLAKARAARAKTLANPRNKKLKRATVVKTRTKKAGYYLIGYDSRDVKHYFTGHSFSTSPGGAVTFPSLVSVKSTAVQIRKNPASRGMRFAAHPC